MHPLLSFVIVIGHRGARAHAPENTLLSIQRGLELGADWIEFDVRLVEDDFVLMHDGLLDRTTDGTGSVEQQSLAYVRGLDAGEGERVPLLVEALDIIGDRAVANVELKTPAAAEALAERLAGIDPERVIVSCFDHRALRRVRRAAPALRIGALIVGLPESNAAFAEALGAWSVHPGAEFTDAELVDDAHARGLRVIPFTVNDETIYRRLTGLGVDGVFSDWPDRILHWRAAGTPPQAS